MRSRTASFVAGAVLALSLAVIPGLLRSGRALGADSDGDREMIAVTGVVGSGTSVLWLVDTRQKQLAVYRSDGGKGVELVGARRIEYDFKLMTYRDQSEAGMRPFDLERGWSERNDASRAESRPSGRSEHRKD